MAKNLNERQSKGDKRLKIAIILNVLIGFIIIIIIGEIIFGVLFKGIYVVQHSMYPTLNGATFDDKHGGDYVYVSPTAKPTYGDIVVVIRNDRSAIIKRAVAFGGDKVKIVDGDLYVMYAGEDEFTLIEESYVGEDRKTDPGKNNYPYSKNGVADEWHLVEENCMFLLGDNRDASVDSRENGDFALDSLYGVVTDWSIKYKDTISKFHIFFKYSLPEFFGVHVKVEGLE